VIGCTSSSSPVDISQRPDLSVLLDMAGVMMLPDLAMPDMTACAHSDTGLEAKSVIKSMTAPQDRMQFGLDLNGDGKVDNQYGNIEGALLANMLDGQPTLDAAIAGGQYLSLIDLTTASFTGDPCVSVRMLTAQAMASLDFSGSGSFTADSAFLPSQLTGRIVSGQFVSDFGVNVTVHVQLPFGGVMVPADLVGSRLQFTLSSTTGVPTMGQLNGAIKEADVQSKLIPAAAAALDQAVTANPTSPQSLQILQVFDIGCSGNVSLKNDGHVAVCEVAQNSIIQNVLAADVQLFDSNGNYHPNPANTNKDSLSVGLGFTAAGATF
jgi:hypothetical protein